MCKYCTYWQYVTTCNVRPQLSALYAHTHMNSRARRVLMLQGSPPPPPPPTTPILELVLHTQYSVYPPPQPVRIHSVCRIFTRFLIDGFEAPPSLPPLFSHFLTICLVLQSPAGIYIGQSISEWSGELYHQISPDQSNLRGDYVMYLRFQTLRNPSLLKREPHYNKTIFLTFFYTFLSKVVKKS
jgi:hypothetical protein